MRLPIDRQPYVFGLGIVVLLLALLLFLWRPWLEPATGEGWQDRNAAMAALFQGNDPPAVRASAVPTSAPPKGQPKQPDTLPPVSAPPSSGAGAALVPQPSPMSQPANQTGTASKIDINQATLAELDRLPGIGPSKAQAILDYRSQVGRFGKPEDLLKVKGIGPKLYQAIQGEIMAE